MAATTTCMLCSCGNSQTIDEGKLTDALGQLIGRPSQSLCRGEIKKFQTALQSADRLLVACEQEAATFEAVAEAQDFAGTITFVDIRDQAGWSRDGAAATPKMAALLAAAQTSLTPPPAVTIQSDGSCIIYGAGQSALDAASQLASRLDVTLLLASEADAILPPHRREFAIMRGRIRNLQGGFGRFTVTLDDAAQLRPDGRAELIFEPASEQMSFDIVVDLSGGQPLVPAPHKHDGYLWADPNDPAAVQRQLLAAADLVGEFDKPRYIDFSADLCAHSRSKRVGCTRCLDACPTGAIQPAGNHVAIDPVICAGCGACAALCPTGAASYQAPRPNELGAKLRTALQTYRNAGGENPLLLVLDDSHGRPLVSALARYGAGLPAQVLPITVDKVGQFGLDLMLAATAYGAVGVAFLTNPDGLEDDTPLKTSALYANEIFKHLGLADARVRIIAERDPDQLHDTLQGWLAVPAPTIEADYLPLGGKRDRLRLGLDAVYGAAPEKVAQIAMPEGAPFGTVEIDADGCTLCLACVGACPTSALIDNPDQPMLRFVEDACVQCGLCQNTCPENVIKLTPRVNFDPAAKSPRLIKEEQPFECIRCGKEFGTQSSINRIVEKLAGSHWMFQNPDQIDRIKMCDDCRVKAQFERNDDPFQMGEKPKTKTTDDYLREREEIEAARRKYKEDNSNS